MFRMQKYRQKCCLLIQLPHLRCESWFFVGFVDFFWNSEMFRMQKYLQQCCLLIWLPLLRCKSWFFVGFVDIFWNSEMFRMQKYLLKCCLLLQELRSLYVCSNLSSIGYCRVFVRTVSSLVHFSLRIVALIRCLDVLREWLIYWVYVCLSFALIISDQLIIIRKVNACDISLVIFERSLPFALFQLWCILSCFFEDVIHLKACVLFCSCIKWGGKPQPL